MQRYLKIRTRINNSGAGIRKNEDPLRAADWSARLGAVADSQQVQGANFKGHLAPTPPLDLAH